MLNKNNRVCIHCEAEYNVKNKLFGLISECNNCGKEGSDKNTPRLGGVMEYSHKTAPVINIMLMGDAKAVLKASERASGTSTVRGFSMGKQK